MKSDPKCQVERCTFPATSLHTLKERDGAFDFPKEVVVCGVHKQQLMDPATEWLLLNEQEGRRLLVGPMLAELNEYLLIEPIAELSCHVASRDFSHPEHDGYHVPLKVRARGGTEETLTLVIPFDLLRPTAEFLSHAIPDSERKNGDK
ncbi:hypothetical protein LAUMK13_02127 [Mycobacterium innocens]|uniref:Uncharacterized protein n=1 Tax=Mycobacterium innocens TaxID=2341083 RepID=A0A498Q1V1_9MYCO|nr:MULTISPECIES: hypothetical protein [Mycobacterium]VBA38532.1 hypothetical protein LAUMK13_02127 [Mycobacterium innocens]